MKLIQYLIEQNIDKIKIVIITGRKNGKDSNDLYRTAKRFKEACDERKIECYVAFSDDGYIARKNGKVYIHNIDDENGFEINSSNTVAIIRGTTGKRKSSLDLISQLERHNIFCVNSRRTMEECSDKYRTALIMADAKIPTPKTAIILGPDGIDVALKKIGKKFPVVLKTLTGSKGIGVFVAESNEGLKSTLQAIWKINPDIEIIMQTYLDADYDIRVHVLGDKVIAAMKRFKIKKDFRSNYSLGGKIEKVDLTEEQEKIAINAAQAVGAVWAGVDIITNKKDKKNYVIEINSSPGTEGIEKATRKDIVSKVINFVLNKNNWKRPATECGYLEVVKVEEIGEMDAKLDTGNGSYCVIHADEYEVDGDKVNWRIGKREFSHKIEGIKTINVGGIETKKEDRPVLSLKVTFNNETYDMKFTLSNRKGFSTPILLNRKFLRLANLSVNSAKKYVLTTKKSV